MAQEATDENTWRSFVWRYRAELGQPGNSRLLDLLAALSHQTNLAVGRNCQDESSCHRSVLRDLL